MATGGPDTSGTGRPGRGVDIAIWVLVIAAMIGLAGAVAWYLSNATFTIREVAFEDASPDPVERRIPVAPAPQASAPDRFPAAPATALSPNAEGVALPVWVRQPAPLYPARALGRGVENGEVSLVCDARVSGRLGACEVVRESPPGAGFAEAALASTRQARVEPRRIDGVKADSRVAYTVRFQLAPEP